MIDYEYFICELQYYFVSLCQLYKMELNGIDKDSDLLCRLRLPSIHTLIHHKYFDYEKHDYSKQSFNQKNDHSRVIIGNDHY
jgi:hypothetical protein